MSFMKNSRLPLRDVTTWESNRDGKSGLRSVSESSPALERLKERVIDVRLATLDESEELALSIAATSGVELKRPEEAAR